MALYLYVNAALYLLFALWCTLAPLKTSSTIGYEVLSQSGRSEFLVVYGGLQLGLAAMFAYTAANPPLQRSGVLIALFFYVPIVLYRVATVLKHWPVRSPTLYVGALEVLLLVAGILVWFMAKPADTLFR
jgi:hypothetical protein